MSESSNDEASDHELENYKHFAEYNGFQANDQTVLPANYRNTKYFRRRQARLRPRTPVYRPIPHDVPPPAARQPSEADRDFLRQDIDELGVYHRTQWHGVRIVGSGTYGTVGLWRGPGDARFPSLIAVKMSNENEPERDLSVEGGIHQRLSATGSAHVVKLLREPQNNGRLIMEYCTNGTLLDLVKKRRRLRMPFKETTLWAIFDCLIDASSVMSFGVEDDFDNNGNVRQNRNDEWVPIIHFDWKDENLLLGDRDLRRHQNVPVVKVSDFGLAVDTAEQFRNGAWKDNTRRRGTYKWYPPEQFTDRWDYTKWDGDTVAGNYGPHTYVWVVGLTMWRLATRDELWPWKAFKPADTRQIRGAKAKGITYGENLDHPDYAYSTSFKDTVFECLYEIPKNRPTLSALKERIHVGWSTTLRVDPEPHEPWPTIRPDEPEVAPNRLAPGLGGRMRLNLNRNPALGNAGN